MTGVWVQILTPIFLVAALFGAAAWLRRDAARDERRDIEVDETKRAAEGKDAYHDARRKNNDAPVDDLVDRLRGRDWGGL
jgi:hypothetical protein